MEGRSGRRRRIRPVAVGADVTVEVLDAADAGVGAAASSMRGPSMSPCLASHAPEQSISAAVNVSATKTARGEDSISVTATASLALSTACWS
ncbi:MAG: hypothetical protein ABIS03_13795 [Gemmatimonadaceae bacterium]